mmetsp:Transcript_111943/g.311653  ORF Transcript_111943/g.311653 Transcript_111943/m.311653 type:complete len:945 (+) Transcript_111943:88-2922(+)
MQDVQLEKRIPYLSILFLGAAVVCHTLVLAGNLHTVNTLNKLGHSSRGWASVGMNLADSFDDFSSSMFAVTNTLVYSIDVAFIVEQAIEDLILNVSKSIERIDKSQSNSGVLSSDGDSLIQLGLSVNSASRKSVHAETPGAGMAGVTCGGPGAAPCHGSVRAAALARGPPGPCEAVAKEADRLLQDVLPQMLELAKKTDPATSQIRQWLLNVGDKVQSYIGHFGLTIAKVEEIFDGIIDALTSALTQDEEMIAQTYSLFDTSNTGFISIWDLGNVSQMFGIAMLQGTRAEAAFERYDENGDDMLDRTEFGRMVLDPSMPGLMADVLRSYAIRLAHIAGPLKLAESRMGVANAVASYLQVVVSKNMTKVGWMAQALTNGSLPLNFTVAVLEQLAMIAENPDKMTTVETGGVIVQRMVGLNPRVVKEVLELMVDPDIWASEGLDPELQPSVVERVTKWAVAAGIPSGVNTCATLVGMAHDNASPGIHSGLQLGARRRQLEGEMRALPALYRWRAERVGHARGAAARAARARGARAAQASSASMFLFEELLGGRELGVAYASGRATRVAKAGQPAAPEVLQFAQWLASNASRTSSMLLTQCFEYSKRMGQTVQGLGNQLHAIADTVFLALHHITEYASSNEVDSLEDAVRVFKHNATDELFEACNRFVLNEPEFGKISVPEDSVWARILRILREIHETLPVVIDALEVARIKVASLASKLAFTFRTIADHAPDHLHHGARFWKILWVTYYILFLIVNFLMLVWIIWLSRFLSGDPLPKQEDYEPPRTMRERLQVFCSNCNMCLKALLIDNRACFWSILLFVEIIVFVSFVTTLILTILALIKLFIHAGCSEFYILGDDTVCSEVMVNIKVWLETFLSSDFLTPYDVCGNRYLLTCRLIGNDLLRSSMLTVVGGFAGSFFNFQSIIEAAILHERVRWYRAYQDLQKEL